MRVINKIFVLLLISISAFAKKEDESFKNALSQLSKERYTEAINLLSSYLSKDEQSPLAYYYRSVAELKEGEALMALGDIDVAISLIRKLPKDSKIGRVEMLLQKAECKNALSEKAEALEILDQVTSLSPDYTAAWVLKAKIMSEQKDFVGADSTFKKALRLDPKNYDALVLYSKDLLAEGKYTQAINNLNSAISVNGESIEPYLLRFQANKSLTNYERAFDDISFVVQNEDDYSPYEEDLKSTAVKCSNYSLPIISSKIGAGERSVMWLLVRAYVYKYNGKFSEAIKDYNSLDEKLGEKYAVIENEVADCYLKLGDNEKALNIYTESLELEETAVAAAGVSYILRCRGELDNSLVYASKAISLDPMRPEYYYVRGEVYEYKGMFGDALSDYEVGIQMGENYSPLYLKRGLLKNSKSDFVKVVSLETSPRPLGNCKLTALKRLGREKEGRDWAERIIKEYPTSENFYTVSVFYASLGDSAKAMANFGKSLEKGYRDFTRIDGEKELDSLRKYDDFVKLCRKYKAESGVESVFASGNEVENDENREKVVKEIKVARNDKSEYVFPVTLNGVNMAAVIDTSLQVSQMSRSDAEFLDKYGYAKIKNDKIIVKLQISDIEVEGVEFELVEDKKSILRLNAVAISKFGLCSINRQNSTLKIER